MMVKVVVLEEDGKIHLTQEELQEMLDDAYKRGMQSTGYYYTKVPTTKKDNSWSWSSRSYL